MMNFVYIIGCAAAGEAGVVDPAWDVPRILETARTLGLKIGHILLTHAHPDHVNGLEALLDATGAKVYFSSKELEYVHEMAKLFKVPIDFMRRHSDDIVGVEDNQEIRIGEIPVRLLHTPGHTPGSQCILVEKNLLTGDTLFVDACGRVDLPGGDPSKMWWSLNQRLNALDDDIIIYPGHNYGGRATSTIGEQKRTNPFMQFASAEDFLISMGRF